MEDGTHTVRLVLRDAPATSMRVQNIRDRQQAALVRVKLEKARARAGSAVQVSAYAGSGARTINGARLYGAAPVSAALE